MAGNPKRRKRILILVGGLVALGAAGAGAWKIRQYQIDADARGERDAGRSALEKGDWQSALEHISNYIYRFDRRGEVTAEDFVLLAKAREKLPEENGRHLGQAVAFLRRAVQMDPSNADAKRDLLDLYLRVGYTTEAFDLIDSLLATTPMDAELLRRRRDLLIRLRRFADALETARTLNGVAPEDVGDHLTTLKLLEETSAAESAIDGWVTETEQAHAGDARFRLLRAAILLRRRQPAEASALLDEAIAATQRVNDADFLRRLAAQLDRARRFGDALSVLERPGAASDPEVRSEVLRRLWYAGRAQDVVERLGAWGADSVRASHESRAIAAAAYRVVGRTADAAPLEAELDSGTDPDSKAWAAFLRAGGDPPANELAGFAESLETGVALDRSSALLRAALGDVLSDLGESQLALSHWAAAASLAPSYARPLCRASEALRAMGDGWQAYLAAREALYRAPKNYFSIRTFVVAVAALGEKLDDRQSRELLEVVRSAQKSLPERAGDTVPIEVDLLARLDRPAAERRIRELLADPPSYSDAVWTELAAVAARAGIPLQSEILSVCEAKTGPTPRLAFARALEAAKDGGGDAALREFERLRESRGAGAATADWDLARARLLERFGDPGAGPEWIRIADSRPDLLQVQLAALAADSVWRDREGTARIVSRVKALSGERGVAWRIARARWILLGGAPTEAEVTEANGLLTDAVRVAPDNAPAHLLLALAAERLGNLRGAEDSLERAAQLEPGKAAIHLEIARISMLQGHAAEAKRAIESALACKDLRSAETERAAFLLGAQGDVQRGVDLLSSLASGAETPRSTVLLLARMYGRLGEFDHALTLCEPLLASPDAEAIELAAALYAASHREAERTAVLARLDELQLAGAAAELLRARHAAEWGDPREAIRWYRAAAEKDPASVPAWDGLLTLSLRTQSAADLRFVLEAPGAEAAESVRFARSHRGDYESALTDPHARVLASAAVAESRFRDVLAEGLSVVARFRERPTERTAAARAMRDLAAAHVQVESLQLVAAVLARESGELKTAAEIAKRAMRQFSESVLAARAAADAAWRLGQWDDALAAGLTWRDRAGRTDPVAAMFVAEAYLHLGKAAEALDELGPLTSAARQNPAALEPVLVIQCMALARDARIDDVRSLLEDLCAKGDRWPLAAIEVDSDRLGDPADADTWLKLCAEFVPPERSDLRLALAAACGRAWERFGDTSFLTAARAHLDALKARADAPAMAFVYSGMLADRAGDEALARKEYEAALVRDPTLAPARNNLAVLLSKAGEFGAAKDQAQQAIALDPNRAAFHDTLAIVCRDAKDLDGAESASRKAMDLDPRFPGWRVTLAEVLRARGDVKGVAEVLAEIDRLVAAGTELDPGTRARLDRLR